MRKGVKIWTDIIMHSEDSAKVVARLMRAVELGDIATLKREHGSGTFTVAGLLSGLPRMAMSRC